METYTGDLERSIISSGEPAWLSGYRREALRRFFDTPYEKEPMFLKYVEGEARFYPEGSALFNGHSLLQSPGKPAQEMNISDPRRLTVNAQRTPDFEVSDIMSAAGKGGTIKKLLLEEKTDDKLEALTNASFNTGLFIHVFKNRNLTFPIRNGFIINDKSTFVLNKMVILAEEGSRLDIVNEIYSQCDGGEYRENMDVYVNGEADVRITTVQNAGSQATVVLNRNVHSEGHSVLNSVNLGGSRIRYRLNAELLAPGAKFDSYEGFFGSGTQDFDMLTKLIHAAPSSQSRFHSRAVLGDQSRSRQKGIIRLLKTAPKSTAYLVEHALSLNEGAKADSVPSLEIETDDVKATHSASSHPLSNEELFYLMSRGFSRKEAERAISLGFLQPVLTAIPSDSLVERIGALLDSKWGKQKQEAKFADLGDYRMDPASSANKIFSGHYKYR